jgi:hypothetical protein
MDPYDPLEGKNGPPFTEVTKVELSTLTARRLRVTEVEVPETVRLETWRKRTLPLESEASALIVYLPQAMPGNETDTSWVPAAGAKATVCGFGVWSPGSRGVRVTVSESAVGRMRRGAVWEAVEPLDEPPAAEEAPCTRNESRRPFWAPEIEVPLVTMGLWHAQTIAAVISNTPASGRKALSSLPWTCLAIDASFYPAVSQLRLETNI